VLKLITSKDSKVRAAEIQLPGHTTVTRAVNYLFPLELNEVSTQPRKALQNGLNNELCLITFSFSWECRGVQAGLDIDNYLILYFIYEILIIVYNAVSVFKSLVSTQSRYELE